MVRLFCEIPKFSFSFSFLAIHLFNFLAIENSSSAIEETYSETGNAIWKNRVESWKEKKNKKKNDEKKLKKRVEAPEEQIIEEKE